ncbi:N-acetylmuramoyl-L-alanine amidase [Segetibacter koreensis]|uniref:N-acetylmuramoyl-L-alanine amidase n=1 Tax=Segetibacter koreensis TaxID=398037 RepID=UPI00037066E3|nr:N-acetylmuramoyl-L-alanine amidase [Segetibacter koreensis]
MTIVDMPSPNHTSGRKKYRPEAVVIHIMEGTLSGTDSWFRDPHSKVSAHYGIGKNGEIHQYVPEMNTAWHAGRVNAPSWPLIKSAGNGLYINPNYYTIGIEHEGKEDSEWNEEMYLASSGLIKDICTNWSIPLDRLHVIGHHEIYSLKTCPGTKVDINKLIRLAGGNVAVPAVTGSITPAKMAEKGKVTTKTRLNIRPQPNTRFKPIITVDPNVQLAHDGFTNDGEVISGIGKWYYTDEGNWFWSGSVTKVSMLPIPLIEVSPAIGDFTVEQIKEASGAKAASAAKFHPFIVDTCTKYEINTPIRRLCFLAQVGHESGGLFFTEELASGRDYEGRADLGNTHPGDGTLYKGRGLIQITGRFNYEALSKDFGEDFITHPERLGGKNVNVCMPEQLKYAALSAGWFWNKRNLNASADQIDIHKPIDEGDNLTHFKMITKKINGGFNGLADRIQKYINGVAFFR